MAAKYNHLLSNLLLVLISTLLAVTLIEYGLRMLFGRRIDFDQVYWVYHPILKRVHPADLNVRIDFPEHARGYFDLVTNNHGLREDQDSNYAHSPDILRILVLGDSHTDGTVFNEECYPNITENLLREKGFAVEALNAGVASYSPFDELIWFSLYGVRYDPDIVLLGMYVGNDLFDLTSFEGISISDEGEIYVDGDLLQPQSLQLSERLRSLLNKSRLVAVIRSARMQRMEATPDMLAHRICQGCFWQSLNQVYRFYRGETDLGASLHRLDIVLAELDRLVSSRDSRLIIVLIPTKRQVESSQADSLRYNRAAQALGLPDEWYDFNDQVREEMLKAIEVRDIEVIDLLPGLQQVYAENGKPLYYFADWHLNPDGHRAVAELIVRHLQAHSAMFSNSGH